MRVWDRIRESSIWRFLGRVLRLGVDYSLACPCLFQRRYVEYRISQLVLMLIDIWLFLSFYLCLSLDGCIIQVRKVCSVPLHHVTVQCTNSSMLVFQNLMLHLPFLDLALLCTHILSFFSSCWYIRYLTEERLNLAHGSGTLVLELGVEEIATADGGDVEACFVVTLVSALFLLSLSYFWLCIFFVCRMVSREGFVRWMVVVGVVVSSIVVSRWMNSWIVRFTVRR